MEPKTITHLYPVWREKANFVIGAKNLKITPEDSNAWEQLWSRKISDNIFEICCIPFFTYDVSLGDEVRTDQEYWIIEVKKRSGHFTFRVWFGNSENPNIREEIVSKVNELNCLFEWYSYNLLAIDSATPDLAKQISGILYEKEQSGQLIFETGQR
mgnify:CR=1 FL=1